MMYLKLYSRGGNPTAIDNSIFDDATQKIVTDPDTDGATDWDWSIAADSGPTSSVQ